MARLPRSTPRPPSFLRRRATRPRTSVAASVARFAAAGLVVTAGLAVLTGVLAQRAGEQEATRSAERLARVVATGVVAPRLTAALAAGDGTARAAMAAAVRPVLAAGPVVRIKVWDAAGRLLWSDEPRLIGLTFGLDDEPREALADDTVVSGVTDLARPENRYERGRGKLLEAYVSVPGGDGRAVLVEVYQAYDAVVEAAGQAWASFAPAGLGALVVLELVQVPFAWGLARRVRRHQQAESALLRAAVDASQAERRRIASDVHDGVVQDLTGLTYDLDAARLRGAGAADGDLVARTAGALRRCVAELRRLLVDLSPPPLPAAGLGPGLERLAAGLAEQGREVTVRAPGAEELPRPAAALLYRVALEAVRNVAAHSDARRVEVVLRRYRGNATLIVSDDGVGFDAERLDERHAAGHLGLRALADLLGETGGSLTTISAPGRGTRLVATVPLAPAPPSPAPALVGAGR